MADTTQGNLFPFERDPVIEFYKKDVDVTLLDENLKLTVEQRLQSLQNFLDAAAELRRGVKAAQGIDEQPR
jgi:hypothetical protein